MNRSSPEVIEKDVGDRRLRSQVSILLDCTDVVENEATVKTVVVDEDAGQH